MEVEILGLKPSFIGFGACNLSLLDLLDSSDNKHVVFPSLPYLHLSVIASFLQNMGVASTLGFQKPGSKH